MLFYSVLLDFVVFFVSFGALRLTGGYLGFLLGCEQNGVNFTVCFLLEKRALQTVPHYSHLFTMFIPARFMSNLLLDGERALAVFLVLFQWKFL